jgi:hypothetical protein
MGLRREVPNWHSSQALEWVLPTFFQGFWGVGTVTKLDRVCFVRGNLKSQAINPPSDPTKPI